MPAIGITGGIATGKSAFSAYLRELLPAATFFDADATARELSATDAEARTLLKQVFGDDIYSADGHLNRTALRSIVFSDPGKRLALEQILHPRIRRRWALEAERHRYTKELFLADIPLLYETGGETLCDRVVVVACSPEMQLRRLMMRTSLQRGAAQAMIDAQDSLAGKMARADHVAWNNGPRNLLKAQAELLISLWSHS